MSYIGNAPTTAAFLVDTFSGTGSQTAFTMTVAPANTSSIIVAVTGVLQSPDTYSVSGTTLTFSAAPPSGTNNISVRYLGIPASGVTTTAYRTVTNTTATAGQTSFTIPSYTVGYVDVYRNGVYLPTTDYTATTGTTVVLNNAATAGDTITTVSFYVSSVLNAIPNTIGSVTPSLLSGNAPQITVYTSGSGTYTTPAYAKAIQVRMVGAGGGGGASSTNSGASGGNTTFGSLTASGGSGGGNWSAGGSGGSASGGDINIQGGGGASGGTGTTSGSIGGQGGNSAFGGGGAGAQPNAAGQSGATNSGGGGSGGNNSYPSGASGASSIGAGGGAGGYVEKIYTSPSATYSYAVGSGGTGGSGAQGGGNGGSGVIIVTAYF